MADPRPGGERLYAAMVLAPLLMVAVGARDRAMRWQSLRAA